MYKFKGNVIKLLTAILLLGIALSPPGALAATTIGANIITNGNLTADGAIKFTSGAAANSALVSTDAAGNAAWTALDTLYVAENPANLYYTDARADARISAQAGAPGGLATLNGSGIVPSAQLPPLAIANTFVVPDQATRLNPILVPAAVGDVCVQTDISTTFILSALPSSVNGNWIVITPPAAVISVNGQTGIVALTPADLGLGVGSSPTFTGLTLSGLTSGSVAFAGVGGTISQDNTNLFWNNTSKRLGIGTNLPAYALDVAGDIKAGNGSFVLLGTKTNPDPAGVNGAMYYNTSIDKFRCFQNSVWKNCDESIAGGDSLQNSYDGGATITTAGAVDIAYTLTSGNFTASGAGSVNLTPTSASSFTSGGALTLTGGAASIWGTSTGNLNLEVAGTGATANVQIGAGVASATPDLLVLDLGSAEPAGTNGALYYDTGTNKFRCYQNSAWTDCINVGGGGGSVLSSLTAAVAANTINNGDNTQTWNWDIINNNKAGITFGENIASTGLGTTIVNVATLAGSTAMPLAINNAGAGRSFRVNDSAPGDSTPFIIDADGNVIIGATTLDPTNPEKLKVDAGSTSSYNVIKGTGDIDSSLNLSMQNRSAGTNAMSVVAAISDSGSASTNTVALGITSSGFNDPVNYGIAGPNDAFLVTLGDDLIVGTAIPGGSIKFISGGGMGTWAEQMRIDGSGNVGIGTTALNARLDLAPATADALRIEPYGAAAGNTGGLEFMELVANGSNYIGFKAPDAITSNVVWTLPNADGTTGQVLSTNGSGTLSWASAFADPMTTRGDLVYRDATNTTARLGVGTNGQVVKSNGTDLSWQTLSGSDVGLGNVTNDAQIKQSIGTAQGDVIAYTASNTPTNLPVGTNNQVLTVDLTTPSGLKWATPASGFADPMTTRGDIIIRNAANTTARLGVGTNGQVVKSNGTDLSWQTLTSSDVGLGSVTNDAQVKKSEYTAKGDILGGTGAGTYSALSVGTNGKVLTADNSQATGLNWTTVMTDPMTTRGDLIYRDATNATARLGVGTAGQVVKSNGTDLSWQTLTSSDVGLGNVTNDAQLKQSIGTAKGDLITYSASNTPVRLPIGGTNGWVLTVDSTIPTVGMAWKANTVANNSLDFAQFSNTMAVDANTSIDLNNKSLTINDTVGGGAGALSMSTNGAALTLTSNGTATWSVTGAGNDLTIDAADVMNLGTTNATALSVGRAAATLAIASTGLNVSTGGALTGVASIDTITTSATDLTFAAAGTISSTTTNALTLDSGTTGAVNLGTGANAKIITIGNDTLATNVNILAGTGNITLGTSDTTGTLLVLDTKTDAGNPGGTNGAMYYNSNANKFRCYENGAWKDCDTGGTLQQAYNAGATITTSGPTDIALTLTSGNFTASGAGAVLLTPTSNSSFTSGGILTLTAGAASTWSTSGGALTVDSAAALNLGTTNATSVSISRGGVLTTVNDGLTVTTTLTASNGMTLTTGALNLTATSGALTLSGMSASSMNFGANALTITSSNFNTTATGINSTAIGTTTAAAGKFTSLTSTGVTDLANAGASNVTIATTGTGTVAIGNATGTFALTSGGGLNVTTGGALTGVASIDANAVAQTLTIGNNTGASTLNLKAGTGSILLSGLATGTSATFLGLPVKTDAGDPTVTQINGAMYYNSNSNKFRCYENSAWKDCDTTGAVSADSLDFTEFKDTMALDASTTIGLATFNLTTNGTGNFSVNNTGTAGITPSGALTLTGGAASTWSTSAGALTITSAAAATWGTTAGDLSLQVAGTGTANVQIGDGGAASATPDKLVLDIGSAEPAGTNGAMYYDNGTNKFRCYENGAWKNCDTTGASAAADMQTAQSIDTALETLTNVGAAQVIIASVSITPTTATGDIIIHSQFDIFSSNNTDQTLVVNIEDDATCTGNTLATATFTLTLGNGTFEGGVELKALVTDAGAALKGYSLCASTATGDTDINSYALTATVIDNGN